MWRPALIPIRVILLSLCRYHLCAGIVVLPVFGELCSLHSGFKLKLVFCLYIHLKLSMYMKALILLISSVCLPSTRLWFCYNCFRSTPWPCACRWPQQQGCPLIWFIETRSQTRGTVSSCSPYGTRICHPPCIAAGDMKMCSSLASVASLTAGDCSKIPAWDLLP